MIKLEDCWSCPPDSEQNDHQAKMTTEISTQNLYNPKSYNVLSHVKVSWRHFFFKSIQCTQIRTQLQKSFWYVIVWYEPPVIPFFTRHQMLWNVMGMVNPKRFEKKAQSIKSTYHWILVMFSLNPRIPLVSFVSNTCWLLWYTQLNFKYPYSITVSWELRDSLHALAILFAYTWCNIVTCPPKEIVFAQPRGQTDSRYLSVTGLHKPFNINPFNTRDWYTGLIMVILRKGPELLGVERVKITVMQTKVHCLECSMSGGYLTGKWWNSA